MLEPYAVKVARTVLRRLPPREGGRLSDIPCTPDPLATKDLEKTSTLDRLTATRGRRKLRAERVRRELFA